MTTWTEKVLYEGQLPISKTTLYTATGVRVNVRYISVAETLGGAVTIIFYYKKATSRRTKRIVLSANGWYESEVLFQLDSGDILEGEASVASCVDTLITGVTVA